MANSDTPTAQDMTHIDKVLATGLIAGKPNPFDWDESYTSYPLYIFRGQTAYEVASMTVYPDGELQVLKRYDVADRVTTLKAWYKLAAALGHPLIPYVPIPELLRHTP